MHIHIPAFLRLLTAFRCTLRTQNHGPSFCVGFLLTRDQRPMGCRMIFAFVDILKQIIRPLLHESHQFVPWAKLHFGVWGYRSQCGPPQHHLPLPCLPNTRFPLEHRHMCVCVCVSYQGSPMLRSYSSAWNRCWNSSRPTIRGIGHFAGEYLGLVGMVSEA